MDKKELKELERRWKQNNKAKNQASKFVPYVAPQKQKPQKNFWLDQISTVGGIGGGIAGSFASPILGTAAGGAAGSALGEAIENMIMKEDPTQNVAKEALLGGIFSAGPIKLAKGAGAGVKALASGADDVVGVASKAAMTPLRKKAGQAALGAADDLAVKQFRLTPTQLKNFKGKFGEDAGQVIRKYGFQSADDITEKGIKPLQDEFDSLVTNVAGVTKDSLKKSFDSRINKLLKAAPSDSKAMGQQLKSEADAVMKQFKGDVISGPELNTIRRQFDELVNYTEKVANPSKYGVNKRMADSLRETLQKADPSGTLKNTGKELQKLRQLADNAAKQGELGRGSNPLGLSTLLGGGIGGAAGGPGMALGTAVGTAAINSQTGKKAALKGAEFVGNQLLKNGKNLGQSARGIAGRVTAGSLLEDAVMGQSLENNATSPMAAPKTNPPATAANMQQSYPQEAQQSSPYTKEALIYDISRDPKNMSKYISTYKQLQDIFGVGEAENLSQSSKNAMASSDNAINTVSQLENLYSNAGSGSGRIGGFVKGLAADAGFDENAKVYNSLSKASVTQIAKALAGSGAGTVSDMDAKVIISALPTLQDTPAEAQAKFAALRQRLENARNNTLMYGAGQTDSLENAVLQAQGAY